MCPLVPPELWEQVFESLVFHGRSTLYSLLLVSHQIHDIVKPILYKCIAIGSSSSSVSAHKLLAFSQCIHASRNEQHWKYTRDIVIFMPHVYQASMRQAQERLMFRIFGFPPPIWQQNLESILLYGKLETPDIDCMYGTLYSMKALKRFAWVSQHTPQLASLSALAEDLLVHKSLQHLELHTDFTIPYPVSDDDLPCLRYLNASFKSIIRLLSGRPSITHLRTSLFRGAENCIPLRFPDNHTVKSLSCHSLDALALISFAGYLKGLECLEVHNPRSIHDWLRLIRFNHRSLRLIRITHDKSGHGHTSAQRMFERIPSLEAVEVHRHGMSSSERWYRGEKITVRVEWECLSDEEWCHDWQRDVQISPVSSP